MPDRISADRALNRLREGNKRFVSGTVKRDLSFDHRNRQELLAGQSPFAIVLGCSDSRVPAELVFDQGFGDLFVIRVAGNIVAPSQLGSIEFAAERFGVRLVVVLGHSHCGAVQAALEELECPTESPSPSLGFVVGSLLPGAQAAVARAGCEDRDALVSCAVRENIRRSAEQLRRGSPILEQLIRDGGLLVVGAEYSLETGVVDFFDGLPDEGQ